MLKELKTMFAQQAEQELLQTTRDFHSCRQEEGQSVSSYVLKMKSYIDNLERLGHPVTLSLGYLAELMKMKKNIALGAGGSGIFVIELNTILNRSWIYDTGCGTHICNTTQGLRASRKLKPGALSLYVGNDQREAVEAIGAFIMDGIFEIDLSNSLTNESSVYVVSSKRAKLDLDSALLWHCRLGHISKKRIEKLQHDGLLNSSDLSEFEKCLLYVWKDGKETLHISSGKGQRLTWTNTHRLFQKEVENQLGKTIKSLRSDCGGEYMSQEFLDHLKDHGIIAHHTPLYTPQHNGVSKKRNRTLLDMVRSMMSQKTLPKSFWDYALETAARILNMVPTKKVEKTP
nr:hypothetical protein [Tanacetum cinerariifolium]